MHNHMRRVIVYIDGFNLYHAIHNLQRPELKWLDLSALATSLLDAGDVLVGVKYFSAFATWLPSSYQKHKLYTKALQSQNVDVILGNFKEKPTRCISCGGEWKKHEEKETDVQIATHMVADALTGSVDRLILISADTDLVPPIKMIAAHKPSCEVYVATPPRRIRYCRALSPKIEIRASRIAAARFPNIINMPDGTVIECPEKWKMAE